MKHGSKEDRLKRNISDVIADLEKLGVTKHLSDEYNGFSTQELMSLLEKTHKARLEIEYYEFCTRKALLHRLEYIKEQISEAEYDRLNAELSFNDTTLTVN